MALVQTMLKQLPNWFPTLATYGTASAVTFVYFTEWRVITDYIPLYNLKYKDE